MRILIVGAGGVGTAAVAIAARRDFFEHMVVADYDPARVEHALAQVAGDARFSGARVDASDTASIVALIREHGITHVLNAVDPRFVMPIFDAATRPAWTTWTWRCRCPIRIPSSRSSSPARSWATGSSRWRPSGRPRAAWRWWASAWSPALGHLRPLRPGRAVQRDRRGGRPRRRQPARGRLRLRAVVLHLDDDRGVPQPARHLGGGQGLVHHAAVLRARDVRVPGGHRAGRVRQRGARGGAPDPALGEGEARDLQVRPGRRVHQRAQGPPHAGPRQDRPHHREGRGRSRRATWWRPACPTRPAWATGCTARPAPAPGSRAGKDGRPRQVYLYHVVDSDWSWKEYGSQAVVWQTAINPVIGLELLARGTWSGAACWARRPSSRGRSWTCWSSTGRRGACARRRRGLSSRSGRGRSGSRASNTWGGGAPRRVRARDPAGRHPGSVARRPCPPAPGGGSPGRAGHGRAPAAPASARRCPAARRRAPTPPCWGGESRRRSPRPGRRTPGPHLGRRPGADPGDRPQRRVGGGPAGSAPGPAAASPMRSSRAAARHTARMSSARRRSSPSG